MIAVLQRVAMARVEVAGRTVGEIGPGSLILVCAEAPDTPALADKMVAKRLKLRVFSDEAGKMNRSVQDIRGLLIVSQFTLAADTAGGNRPSFSAAAGRAGPSALRTRATTARRLQCGGGAGRVQGGHESHARQRRAGDDPDAWPGGQPPLRKLVLSYGKAHGAAAAGTRRQRGHRGWGSLCCPSPCFPWQARQASSSTPLHGLGCWTGR